MDDLEKHASSYQQDQEILDARGINMTVEEVAGLSTVKYAEKVQSLQLNDEDLSFLKGLRRRIKNRLASQNSRRRSLEHLRRLARELRAVRTRRAAALAERRALLRRRDLARGSCRRLRNHLKQVLLERSDPSQIPDLDDLESQPPKEIKKSDSPDLSESYRDKTETCRDKNETFECRIEKLVQKSVNHIYEKKKVSAKTVFLDDSDRKAFFEDTACIKDGGEVFIKDEFDVSAGESVLDLCVKEKRRSHGRKQSAPRRVAYVADCNDMVLDLKIKKENQ